MIRLATALMLLSAPALAAEHRRGDVIEGPVAHLRDGDTLEIGPVAVRLNGVAAPELSEAGGTAATEALRGIVEGHTLRCALTGERSHDRWVGTCWIGTLDVSAAVIATGTARDCERFSAGRYAAVEPPASRALPLPAYCTGR